MALIMMVRATTPLSAEAQLFCTGAQQPLPSAGVYLCVRAYGSVPANFALRASIEACPSDFDAAGDVLVCKTRADAPEAERRYSECTATGECVCTGPYAKPVPEVFPGECLSWRCTAKVDWLPSCRYHNRSRVSASPTVPPAGSPRPGVRGLLGHGK